MRVELEQVRLKPFRWSEVRTLPAAQLEESEVIELGEITWQGEIRYAEPGFILTGSVSYDQTVECRRCLEPVDVPVQTELELLLLVDEDDVAPGEVELEEEDLGVVHLAGDGLDLDALLLEQLELEVPMRVVCREDCKGLCPSCGANRNEIDCGCDTGEVDPRWGELMKFRRELD